MNISHRDRVLLAVIVVAGVLAGGFFFVVKPKRAEMRALDTQISTAQSRLDTAVSTLDNEQAAKARISHDLGGLLAAGKAVPTTVAMPALLRQLQSTGDRGGVTMTSFTTGGTSAAAPTSTSTPSTGATAGVQTQTLQLQFGGGFIDLQRFLAHLQSFVDVSRQRVQATGRLLALDSVQLASAGAKAKGLTAQVGATIYSLDPQALRAAAAPGASTPAGASAPSTPTPTATAEVTR